MSGLVEKLEAAEAGSRELDWRLADLTDHPSFEKRFENMWPGFGEGSKLDLAIPRYTTSLDAALALAERVLPGQARALGDMAFEPPGKPWAVVWTKGGDPKFTAEAPTPALALCAAILRALNLNETRHD